MPRLVVIAAVIALCALCAASVPAGADDLVKFDFEQKYFLEWGPEIKDHSIYRQDGVYHLYYLRGKPAVNIGHAVSTDLVHWELKPPLLSTTPGAWDGGALWAPHVIWNGVSNYIMYYTGVNQRVSQQTGIALSLDLEDWTKLPYPVYRPNTSWAEWYPDRFCHGRDPFFFEHDGNYYLLNTAKTWADRGAIACAQSNDFINWVDIGPLYVHNTWHVLESVQLKKRAGRFHLFFTEETVAGTSYMASDSLFSGWDIVDRIVIDFGHAPEVNEFDPGSYVFSRHSTHSWGDGTYQYVIRLDSLRWGPTGYPYVHRPWPLASQWTIVSGSGFSYQPTFLNNPARRGVNVDVGYEGLCWLSTYELYQGPLGVGSPGQSLGEGPTGVIRSRAFTVTGKSMNLLVGGTNDEANCYVALVDATTQAVLYKETGRDTDAMDRRYWHLVPYEGQSVYIEIADNSTSGHICCDDITESPDVIVHTVNEGSDTNKRRPQNTEGIEPEAGEAPALLQNSPNPFNPTTVISYRLPEQSGVELVVFDVRGDRVRTLVSAREEAGVHSVGWDGRGEQGETMATGIYFYRLVVDGRTVDTKKMILLK